MENNTLFEIDGFDELNVKLKKLPDRVKRLEILKIQRRAMRPAVEAYRRELPQSDSGSTRYVKKGKSKTQGISHVAGNLKKSVRVKTVPAKYTDGNPHLQVLPDKTGKYDGYYKFMVVKKGFTGSGRGSRIGHNTVVPVARDKAYEATKGRILDDAAEKIKKYIQKRIDTL